MESHKKLEAYRTFQKRVTENVTAGDISISRQQLKASYLLRVCMMLDGPQSISGGCNYLCGDFTIGESPIPNDFILFLKDCINTEPGADEESEGILAASAQLLLLLTNSHFCNNAPSLSNLTNRCQSLPILASLRAKGQKGTKKF